MKKIMKKLLSNTSKPLLVVIAVVIILGLMFFGVFDILAILAAIATGAAMFSGWI